MKIGVFSGSFDPIHCGHAMIANYASQWLDLDEVWLMVSPRNPLKGDRQPAPDQDRLAMVAMVADKCERVKASDFEFSLPVPSYTYNTLISLRDAFPEHTFSLIIGSDNWLRFREWKNHDRIADEFSILIYPRPGYPVNAKELPAKTSVAEEAPQAVISSSFVRNSFKEGKNLNFFLPPEVFDYIKKNNLYS